MFNRIVHLIVFASVLASLFAAAPAQPAHAAGIIYVNDDAAGANNGTSWTNAYTDLQSALAAAASGDQIWVAAGTYKPTTTTQRFISFTLKNGVAVYGGFAGTESSLSERDPAANVTILSGDIGTANDMSDNSYHVVNASSTLNTAVLDGFTITGGNATGIGSNGNGGGIFILTSASPALSNLIISNNHANDKGGGMYNYIDITPSLTNVTFTGNSAALGGGVYTQDADPTLTNVTFSGNTASNMGGGMYNTDGSVPILTNVTFIGNSAASAGGGMRNIVCDPILINVTFTENSAAFGGGMQNLGANPTLTNVTFSGNTAGGAIYNGSSNPTIRNSIMYGNTGGEIVDTNSSAPVVTYSIVQGGYAGEGNLDADPMLGALANNGGFTQTMALSAGSPAIDAGTNSGCPATDQRGIARPFGIQCDIGAYEVNSATLTLISTDSQDGWILESTETSGVGGTKNNTASTLNVGDDAANKQYRAMLSFDTTLPANAVITGVTLKFKYAGKSGTLPFSTHGKLLVDVRHVSPFGNNAALQLGDFKSGANKSA
ncbi:MAG: hypothetical protein DPW18_02645, partial [Chloroflexi bacterium]|nr:hypothetical protein [Chloroflexota bacterium]MDL1942921.1 hypothetical protein [Chloroflexi bacterium CFX2]